MPLSLRVRLTPIWVLRLPKNLISLGNLADSAHRILLCHYRAELSLGNDPSKGLYTVLMKPQVRVTTERILFEQRPPGDAAAVCSRAARNAARRGDTTGSALRMRRTRGPAPNACETGATFCPRFADQRAMAVTGGTGEAGVGMAFERDGGKPRRAYSTVYGLPSAARSPFTYLEFLPRQMGKRAAISCRRSMLSGGALSSMTTYSSIGSGHLRAGRGAVRWSHATGEKSIVARILRSYVQ